VSSTLLLLHDASISCSLSLSLPGCFALGGGSD
jgi:hypothetical protein